MTPLGIQRPPTPRYRVVVFGRPRGPWRDQREHAVQDAIDQGLAAWDASRREHFIAVPTDIETRRT
jgi:hypothetical protein